MDTYEALHERSPFAVDCICMVAARVRDGGGMDNTFFLQLSALKITVSGKSSELYLKCLEEVQAISSATLFAPVVRSEAVQSMSSSFSECIQFLLINILLLLVLVSGWSDNGWLSGGHAVRMAMELCLSPFARMVRFSILKLTCSNAQGLAKTSKTNEHKQNGCR